MTVFIERQANRAVDKFILFVKKYNLPLQILLGVALGIDFGTIDFMKSNDQIYTMDYVINFFMPDWKIRVPATSGYFDPWWGFAGAASFLVLPITLFTLEGIVLKFSNYRTRTGFFLSFIVCVVIFSATWDLIFTNYIYTYWSADLRGDEVDWLPPIANVWYYVGFSTSPTFKIAFTWEAGMVLIGFRYACAILGIGYIVRKEREARSRNTNELVVIRR